MMARDYTRPLDTAPPLRSRILRFLGAGVINTAFGYALFAVLVFLGAHPQIALVVQFILGVLWNYRVHGRYVFGVRGYGRLPPYALSYVFIYISNAFLLQALIKSGLDPYIAQAIALGPIVVLSYVLISHALGLSTRTVSEDLI